jgi:DNA-binding NarL/FixJ family response regulator
MNGKKTAVADYNIPLDRFNQTEVLIVQLVGEGLSNEQIANRLYVSMPVVKNHLTNIARKIGEGKRYMMVMYFYRRGLIS